MRCLSVFDFRFAKGETPRQTEHPDKNVRVLRGCEIKGLP